MRDSDLLMDVLNGVLKPTQDPHHTHVTIDNPSLEKDNEAKYSVLDILATAERGQRFKVEMQTSTPAFLVERLVYYTSSLFGVAVSDEADLMLWELPVLETRAAELLARLEPNRKC